MTDQRPPATDTDGGQADDAPPPEPLEQISRTVVTLLDDVLADGVLLRAVAAAAPTANAHAPMKVLSSEARAAAGQELRSEHQLRAARRLCTCPVCRKYGEQPGHAWMRRDVVDQARGAVPAPTNVTATSLSEEITRTLHRIRIDLTDYDHVHRLPAQLGIEHLARAVDHAAQLARVAIETDRAALQRSRAALEDLDARARAFLETRNERTYLGRRFPCPHCGRHSLVAFWRAGDDHEDYIRCDRVPGEEHYQPCVCRSAICECKTRPVAYRHTWSKTAIQSSSSSFHGLARALRSQDAAGVLQIPDPDKRPTPPKEAP